MNRYVSTMQFVPQVAAAATLRNSAIRWTVAGVLLAVLAAQANPSCAQIFTSNTGQLIPGTQGITPGPGVDLSGWNTPGHQLENAALGSIDLTGATFYASDLTGALLRSSTLTNANFSGANLTNAILESINAPNTNFGGANLTSASFYATTETTLTNASFANANLASAGSLWRGS